jgi:hypothetical protein
MSKERNPLSYLDDWGPAKPLDGDAADRRSASGADIGSEEAAYGYAAPSIPFNQDVPLNPEWGMLGKGRGGFGHSADVESKQDYAAWDMKKSDVERGYERPGSGDAGKPGTASFEQSIPSTNEHDRGAGSDSFSREGEWAGGEGFDGVGNDKPSPGREAMGSSKLVG